MTHARLSSALALLLFVGLSTTSAQAQPSHVFVAGNGSDRNPCTFARPCRTFQHAHDAVNSSGGVVDVLDPADYGPVSIIQSISILGHGWATVSTDSQHNIGISIDNANITVSIDGVRLEGVNFGGTGIALNVAANLFINNCVVRNFSGAGVGMKPPGDSNIMISNTVVDSNGQNGIYLQPTGGTFVTATFNRIVSNRNGQNGIAIYGNQAPSAFIEATIVDSVVNRNAASGIYTLGVSAEGNQTGVDVHRSTVQHHANRDLFADDYASIFISESKFDNFRQSTNGCIKSFGNNITYNPAPCGTLGPH